MAMNPKGFTLRMIHKDSEESPFFNPLDHLITQDERFQTLIDQSRARARHIASKIDPDIDVPVVYDEGTFYYAAHVRIGTFPDIQPPFMNYYFLIDSGSDLTWLQCEGATQFFNQDSPLYPWNNSQSYIPAGCQDPSPGCDRCDGYGQCVYTLSYGSSQVTSGVIAKENFTFTGGHETIQLLMGCGLRQANFTMGDNGSKGKPDLIAGIIGLGRGPRSFVTQLGPRGGKFSYCFEKYSGGNTYLNFGADATIGGQVRTTPMVRTNFVTSYYYLNLVGISVGGDRVPIPSSEFEINQDDQTSGCIIDSGAPWTTMYRNIFDRVAQSVEDYFLSNNGMRRAGFTGSWVCFIPILGKEYTKPIIIFHFEQADYVVSETWFERQGNICLAMVSSDSNTPAVLLGAFQQVNKRILYDNMDMSLSFVDENC
ncbi:aspartic proteinase nepenthesin-2-like [Papaver somniferum]|uniref:aspartic proteinase nepenthesin-2-like n=1 Tax=Papaver somniferum TaxID=3469 RepID=UPI000E6FE3E3|nr:aspartic proteinase nepenthesin-2-like [Papaver somniferum]